MDKAKTEQKKMDCNSIKQGIRVRTTALEDTKGMMIAPRHLECRAAGIVGTVRADVPGHGGDVWFVAHDGGDEVGAYCFTELERNAA